MKRNKTHIKIIVAVCSALLWFDSGLACAQNTTAAGFMHAAERYRLDPPRDLPDARDPNNVYKQNPDLRTHDDNEIPLDQMLPGWSEEDRKETREKLRESLKRLHEAFRRKMRRLQSDYQKELQQLKEQEREKYMQKRKQLDEECRNQAKSKASNEERRRIGQACSEKRSALKAEYKAILGEKKDQLLFKYLEYKQQLREDYYEFQRKITEKHHQRHWDRHNTKEDDI